MKKVFIVILLFFLNILYINAEDYQDIILRKVNNFRVESGLKPLKLNKELNKIAIVKAKDMAKEDQLKHRWNKEKTIVTYKAHNGQDLPLPRYYKTTIYTDDQRQLLWLYAEDKGVKWVKGFEVIGANTVNKDYYERLLKEKNENGIGLHEDNIEEIERKKAINRMAKLQNLTNRKKAQRRQIRREEEDIMYQYLSADYCPF